MGWTLGGMVELTDSILKQCLSVAKENRHGVLTSFHLSNWLYSNQLKLTISRIDQIIPQISPKRCQRKTSRYFWTNRVCIALDATQLDVKKALSVAKEKRHASLDQYGSPLLMITRLHMPQFEVKYGQSVAKEKRHATCGHPDEQQSVISSLF